MLLPEEASGPRRRGSLPVGRLVGPDKSKRTGSVELPPVPNCAFVVSYGTGLINPLNCISGGIIGFCGLLGNNNSLMPASTSRCCDTGNCVVMSPGTVGVVT